MSYIYFALSIICFGLFFLLRPKRELSERLIIAGGGVVTFIIGIADIAPTKQSIILQLNLHILLAVLGVLIIWSEIFKDAPKNWLAKLPDDDTITIGNNLLTYAFSIALLILPVIFLIKDNIHVSEYLYGGLITLLVITSFVYLEKTKEFNEYVIAICLISTESLMIHIDAHQIEEFRMTARVNTDGWMFIFAGLLLFIRGHYTNGLASLIRNLIKGIVSDKKW